MEEPCNDPSLALRTLRFRRAIVVTERRLSPRQAARLRAAISALPEPRRSIYLLCARDQLAYSEIATRLELTVPEVRRFLAEALAQLFEAIDGDAGPHSLQ